MTSEPLRWTASGTRRTRWTLALTVGAVLAITAGFVGLLLVHQSAPTGSSHFQALDSPTTSLLKVWDNTGTNTAYAFQYGFTSVPTPIDLVSVNITLKDSAGHTLTNHNWYALVLEDSSGTVICGETFASGSSEGVVQIGTHSSCTTSTAVTLGFAESGQAANVVYSYGVDTGSSGGFTITMPSSWADYNTQPGQMPNSFECGWTNPLGWD